MKQKLFSNPPCVLDWEINISRYGAAQPRQRHLWITSHKRSKVTPSQVPILLGPTQLPKTLRGYLQVSDPNDVIEGSETFYETQFGDVRNPFLLGVVSVENVSANTVSLVLSVDSSCDPVSTNKTKQFKFFSVDGPSFPLGKFATPAGHGHTLIFDPNNSCVRRLSLLKCWLLAGGNKTDFCANLFPTEQWASLFLHYNHLN